MKKRLFKKRTAFAWTQNFSFATTSPQKTLPIPCEKLLATAAYSWPTLFLEDKLDEGGVEIVADVLVLFLFHDKFV
jgi:hypothetical protein